MDLEYRDACERDLEGVVLVHLRSFAGFFLSRLGAGFLREYYRLILNNDGGVLVVAAEQGEPVGFAAGYASPVSFHSELKRRRLSFALAALPALLKDHGVLRRLWLDYRQVHRLSTPESGGESGELSSIGVLPTESGRGIGKGLLEAFVFRMERRGVPGITLTTDAEGNDGVNEFYRKAGFSLVRGFTQGDGRKMNEYRLGLPCSELFRRS